MNCLIVDDEPISRAIIEGYCAHLPNLNVIATCDNAFKARAILQQEHVDILFLDINMPVMDGMSFLKTLNSRPQVIITTAYSKYALDAFDLAAVDYLLKPFSLERFIIAVDKAVERTRTGDKIVPNGQPYHGEYCFIKAEGRIYKVLFDEVIYAEASGNNTKIVTVQRALMPAMTFAAVAELLPPPAFLRVHRSFIINRSKIQHLEGNRVYLNNIEIPIGSSYKENFLKALGVQ